MFFKNLPQTKGLHLQTPTQESYTVTLNMPTPVKHKKSGIYYVRVRVPADLKGNVGRAEVSKSLRTRDPSEAKERFATEYAKIQKRWASLRAKPEPLPLKKIVALSGRVYFRLMEMLENEPGEPAIWKQVLRLSQEAEAAEGGMEKWYGVFADEILAEEGIAIDQPTRVRLLREVHKSWTQAARQQLKRAEGDFSPDPQAMRFPEWETTTSPKVTTEGPSLTSLFERWKKDHLSNGKAVATINDFAQKKDALVEYLGHEDVTRIKPKDIADWCDYLRDEKGLKPKTIGRKYLAAIRAVLRLARSKFLIESDPSADVSVKVPQPVTERSKGFTDDEAKRILRHANEVLTDKTRATRKNKLACRWIPWICAYTGARAGEVAQLRKQDLRNDGDIHYLLITPDAGSVKARRYRTVPLHPHLIEIGLVDFINSVSEGYLFHGGGKTPNDALRLSQNAR
ncbi:MULTISPECIES: site-specific integrase [unclassified Ruegeria]|uniref:site-specific integrase n=1 Tax=unclassified Ruegeria TaxID=2625375 RepID=UPI001488A407|nr:MULTISPECIES: site-specific integrase [unclassified Ruegeria]